MDTFIELKGQHRIWQQQLLTPGESGLIASGWDEQGHVIIKFPVIMSNFKKSTTRNPRNLNVRKTKDAEEKRCGLWNEVELYSDSGIDYINLVKLSEPVSEMGLMPPHIVSVGKESACNAGAPPWFYSGVGRISWRRERLPTAVY